LATAFLGLDNLATYFPVETILQLIPPTDWGGNHFAARIRVREIDGGSVSPRAMPRSSGGAALI